MFTSGLDVVWLPPTPKPSCTSGGERPCARLVTTSRQFVQFVIIDRQCTTFQRATPCSSSRHGNNLSCSKISIVITKTTNVHFTNNFSYQLRWAFKPAKNVCGSSTGSSPMIPRNVNDDDENNQQQHRRHATHAKT